MQLWVTPININDSVRVRMTDEGRELARQELGTIPKEVDGWSVWQLHTLMSALGRYLVLGMPLPFETEIQWVSERRPSGTVETRSAALPS